MNSTTIMAALNQEPEPMQCTIIKANGTSSPPPPAPSNSKRAHSRKNRVYSFHSFLVQTFSLSKSSTVLDVAGGRGDLSFILNNFSRVKSTIADPRVPNFTRLIKSVQFLIANPDEAKQRSVQGRDTFQPLAKCIAESSLREQSNGDDATNKLKLSLQPTNLRIHVDKSLVQAIQSITSYSNGKLVIISNSLSIWDEYWNAESKRIQSNNIYYGGTEPKDRGSAKSGDNQIKDSRDALETFLGLDLIVGFHPDQATEATIDLAIHLHIPFAIVPCCVFPSEFPNRKYNGKIVKSYTDFIEYLLAKHKRIRTDRLDFIEDTAETGKSLVLYMLTEDFE